MAPHSAAHNPRGTVTVRWNCSITTWRCMAPPPGGRRAYQVSKSGSEPSQSCGTVEPPRLLAEKAVWRRPTARLNRTLTGARRSDVGFDHRQFGGQQVEGLVGDDRLASQPA